VTVLEGVFQASGANTASAHWAMSDRGSLMYIPGQMLSNAGGVLAFLNRQGDAARLMLPQRLYSFPRRSPDGRRLAVVIDDNGDNVWTYDLSGGSAIARLTFDGQNRYPVWSRDSEYLFFQSDRGGDLAIWRQRADTPGSAERLTHPDKGQAHVPHALTADDSTLLLSASAADSYSLWTYSIRDEQLKPLADDLKDSFQLGAELSPDGRWLAYHSNDERRSNMVLVRPFPPDGTRYQVGPGANPFWSPDGKELFFTMGPGNPIQAVHVDTDHGFRVIGTPAQIPRQGVFGFDAIRGRNFESFPDGRLLVVMAAQDTRTTATTINVVLNWLEELKDRVPVREAR
jgi:dipeptidyl aminopeptidase/acylaminoacyl peptidase